MRGVKRPGHLGNGQYAAGYRDGSGRDCVTRNGEAIAVTAWGCSCCKPDVNAEHRRMARRIAKALNLLAQHEARLKADRRARKSAPVVWGNAGVGKSVALVNIGEVLESALRRLHEQQKIGGK